MKRPILSVAVIVLPLIVACSHSDKAIADFTDTIRLKPTFAEAYHWRGITHKHNGDGAKAQSDFDRAKQIGGKD